MLFGVALSNSRTLGRCVSLHCVLASNPCSKHVHRYLAHKNAPPPLPRTVKKAGSWDAMVVLGRRALSYQRGTGLLRS